MTDQNLDAPGPLESKIRTEVQAFACRITVDTAGRAADIYERVARGACDLLSALADQMELGRELQDLYGPDAPEDMETGDWLAAIEDWIGLSAARYLTLEVAARIEELAEGTAGNVPASALDWPETAWPLGAPR